MTPKSPKIPKNEIFKKSIAKKSAKMFPRVKNDADSEFLTYFYPGIDEKARKRCFHDDFLKKLSLQCFHFYQTL